MKISGCKTSGRNVTSFSILWVVLGLSMISMAMGLAGPPDEKADAQGSDAHSGGGAPAGPPAMPVLVDMVQMENVPLMRRVTGEIRARRRSIVASQESGLVLDLPYEPGDSVTLGVVIARLDSALLELQTAELRAKLRESEATVAEQESELSQAKRDLQSLLDLQEEGAAKPKELNDARTTLRTAEARLNGAKRAAAVVSAEKKSIEKRLEHKTVRAPFDGVIVAKQTEVGQWVNEGGAIVEMIESGLVDAVLEVPEDYINHIQTGSKVEVSLRAFALPIAGHVRRVVPLGDSRAHTFPVKVELGDMDGQVKPFMTVEAWVPTGVNENAMTIRKDAVLQNETGSYVYVMRGGRAEISPVRPIFSAGMDRVVVLGGLEAGDPVIYEGNERLYPGAPVVITSGEDIQGENSGRRDEGDGHDSQVKRSEHE